MRLDSTPRGRTVNVAARSQRSRARRASCARAATRCAMLSAAITAMRSTPVDLAAVADLAHPLVEEGDRFDQLGALVLLARDLVVAAEDDVEGERRSGDAGVFGVIGCLRAALGQFALGRPRACLRRPLIRRASGRSARRGARLACCTLDASSSRLRSVRRRQVAAQRLVGRAQRARVRDQRGELLFERGEVVVHGARVDSGHYRRRAARRVNRDRALVSAARPRRRLRARRSAPRRSRAPRRRPACAASPCRLRAP